MGQISTDRDQESEVQTLNPGADGPAVLRVKSRGESAVWTVIHQSRFSSGETKLCCFDSAERLNPLPKLKFADSSGFESARSSTFLKLNSLDPARLKRRVIN
jgi:hypothetical protein